MRKTRKKNATLSLQDAKPINRETTIEALLNLIQSATPDDLECISESEGHANPGDNLIHLSALNKLIFEQNCIIYPDQSWFPSEPVELASFVYDPNNIRPFAICTAILIINDLENDDADFMRWRWKNHEEEYRKLPEEFRQPILAGVTILRARWSADENRIKKLPGFQQWWLNNY